MRVVSPALRGSLAERFLGRDLGAPPPFVNIFAAFALQATRPQYARRQGAPLSRQPYSRRDGGSERFWQPLRVGKLCAECGFGCLRPTRFCQNRVSSDG